MTRHTPDYEPRARYVRPIGGHFRAAGYAAHIRKGRLTRCANRPLTSVSGCSPVVVDEYDPSVGELWDSPAPGVVHLPSGRLVRGRALSRPMPDGPRPALGIYLLDWRPPAVPWESRWLRWPDFGLPADPAAVLLTLTEAGSAPRRSELRSAALVATGVPERPLPAWPSSMACLPQRRSRSCASKAPPLSLGRPAAHAGPRQCGSPDRQGSSVRRTAQRCKRGHALAATGHCHEYGTLIVTFGGKRQEIFTAIWRGSRGGWT